MKHDGMNCDDFRAIAMDWMFGELTDEVQQRAADDHVKSCVSCASWAKGFQGIRCEMDGMNEAPPAGLQDAILAKTVGVRRQPDRLQTLMRQMSEPQWSMAAVVLLMVGASVVLFRIPGFQPNRSVEIPSALKEVESHREAAKADGRAAVAVTSTEENAASAPGESSEGNEFDRAVELYRDQKDELAQPIFETIAASPDPKAPEAALYAARSQRRQAGCTGSVKRFETLAAQERNEPVGVEAALEAASCNRELGRLAQARTQYNHVANEAQDSEKKAAARRALDELSSESPVRARAAAPAGKAAAEAAY